MKWVVFSLANVASCCQKVLVRLRRVVFVEGPQNAKMVSMALLVDTRALRRTLVRAGEC